MSLQQIGAAAAAAAGADFVAPDERGRDPPHSASGHGGAGVGAGVVAESPDENPRVDLARGPNRAHRAA